jgi:hypothetical protein
MRYSIALFLVWALLARIDQMQSKINLLRADLEAVAYQVEIEAKLPPGWLIESDLTRNQRATNETLERIKKRHKLGCN